MTKESNVNERKIALEILEKIKGKKATLGPCLNKYLGARKLDKRSRAFITRLVYGALENIIKLDYIINSFSSIKVNKMRPKVAIILEMSVYQLLLMDVPVSAVCNEAVKLTGKLGFTSLKPFVNGLLRNIERNINAISFPDFKENPVQALSIEYSVPEWLVQLWLEQMTFDEAKGLLAGLRKNSSIYIRCNTEKIKTSDLIKRLEREGLIVTSDYDWPSYTLKIEGIDSLENLDTFKEGLFYVQDLSCMLSGQMYGLKKGDKVLDVCAAPGGKSINAALILKGLGGGCVTSRDLTEAKTNLIKENMERLSIDNVSVETKDARIGDGHREYDIVVVDAPCSGLGIIGRKPDILLNRKVEDIASLVDLQKEIVKAAITNLKVNGRLVYSTCTINKAENEDMVNWIERTFRLKLLAVRKELPGLSTNGNENMHDHDGFFTAVFTS